jgi:hypothetical protein
MGVFWLIGLVGREEKGGGRIWGGIDLSCACVGRKR